MHDACRMRSVDRIGRVAQPLQRLGAREAACCEPVVHAAAGEEVHDDERPPVPLAGVVDRDDVGMAAKSRGENGLAGEPGGNAWIAAEALG